MKSKKSLYMGTTKISAQQTVGELVGELVKAGALSVNTDYQRGQVTGIKWVMKVNGIETLFDMPARVEPLLRLIRDLDQARRTAWRQLLRWVQAQNALIDVGMVQPAEVYYAFVVPPGSNQTLFELALQTQFKQLAAPVERI